ncbi:PhzF family phenazine biosynthesis protein [Acetoanaerobium pronyense]|uniref:PhzF family phenazine biosynthesis protein n=1 Tax=Acetoanaerobium pronyense TaxID=1482736 RepID=A0ABS4KM23_9FIRM|nr:PhzF family phenazine biosynthesis protein [Acetoanaerobium pronyense]MBP2028813.1 PhzF family phenazine biosynthesis protein [Acetoanaerobium pronyense]
MISVHTLDSFTSVLDGGNPAGVVLNADHLSEEEMQKIANKVGFSETAFVMKSHNADFKVRFFTPSDEVDLCGHATIATFKLLFLKQIITFGNYTQETKAGILNVEIRDPGLVFMNQSLPSHMGEIPKYKIAKSLGISESDIIDDLPVEMVSTGLLDIIVPIKSLEILKSIEPDFDMVSEISKEYDAVGYHIFTKETLHNKTCSCRNLAPLYGIPEEAATGTASGALLSYLFKHELLDNYEDVTFEQGYFMERPSLIYGSLKISENNIEKVIIGGDAVIANEIKLYL